MPFAALLGPGLDGEDRRLVERYELVQAPSATLVCMLRTLRTLRTACETARCTHARGEGVLGLLRAFLDADVSRVVPTDWCVPDDSTPDLMAVFYDHLLIDGLTTAEALRQAQVSRLRAGGRLAHPYH